MNDVRWNFGEPSDKGADEAIAARCAELLAEDSDEIAKLCVKISKVTNGEKTGVGYAALLLVLLAKIGGAPKETQGGLKLFARRLMKLPAPFSTKGKK